MFQTHTGRNASGDTFGGYLTQKQQQPSQDDTRWRAQHKASDNSQGNRKLSISSESVNNQSHKDTAKVSITKESLATKIASEKESALRNTEDDAIHIMGYEDDIFTGDTIE